MKQILVGGGASSLVFGNLSRKLNKVDLKVGWHVSDIDGDKFTTIPEGCEGVIILRDMIGHVLYHSIVGEAKKKDLPLAAIPRKWSHAEPILRLQGFLPDPHPLKKAASREVVLETAVFYMDRERDKGRVPKIDEVEAVVKKTLGPKTSLSQEEYKAAVSRSAATNAKKVAPVKGVPSLKASEVGLWVETVLEEHPDKVINARKLASEMIKEYGNIPKAALLVEEAVAGVKKRWKSRNSGDRKWRNGIMYRWLVRWFQRAVDGKTKVWPTYTSVGKKARRVFGTKINWDVVQKARAEVLGDWAFELQGVKKLAGYYEANRPKAALSFDHALECDLIQSIVIPGGNGFRTYTSEQAIQTYWKSLEPKPERKPTPKPEVTVKTETPQLDLQVTPTDPTAALLEATRSLQATVEALSQRVEALETPAKGPQEVSLDFGELLARLPSVTIKIELHPKQK